jgi:hypothetical protein
MNTQRYNRISSTEKDVQNRFVCQPTAIPLPGTLNSSFQRFVSAKSCCTYLCANKNETLPPNKTAKTIFVQTSRLGLLIIGTQSALRMDLAFSNSAAGPIASTHKRELSCRQLLLLSDHFFQHYCSTFSTKKKQLAQQQQSSTLPCTLTIRLTLLSIALGTIDKKKIKIHKLRTLP